MSYTAHPTVVTGQTWTAANQNTYVRDNLAALWIFTTAGDMIYATSASVAARLAIGASGYMMMSTGSAPSWIVFYRNWIAQLNADAALTVGDDAARFRVPTAISGWNIHSVSASRKSGTAVPAIQVRNVSTGLDVLSTKVTIDSGETDSNTAAAAAVVNTSNDDVTAGQQLAIDVDVAGTDTLYMVVSVQFLKP